MIKNYKKIICISSFLFSSIISISVLAFNCLNFSQRTDSENDDYIISFDSSEQTKEGSFVKETTNGNKINFIQKISAQTIAENCWRTLSSGDYIYVSDYSSGTKGINGLKSLEVTYLGETNANEIKVFYGWQQGVYTRVSTISSSSFDFNGKNPTYFRIENATNISLNIKTLKITYSCVKSERDITDGLGIKENDSGLMVVKAKTANLVDVIIPSDYSGKKVKIIDVVGFSYCDKTLVSIFIPLTITEIGRGAFLDCSYLSYIKYEGYTNQWKLGVTKGNNWADGINTTVVHCEDGDIDI